MKKRLIALCLALAMLISVMPGMTFGVYAEGDNDTAHVHCMCGAEKTLDAVCAKCGEKAVEWTAADTMPSATGNYYLTQTVSAAPQFITGQQIAICLHGSNIQSAAGKMIAELQTGTSLTITDCDINNEVGSITGCNTNTSGTVFRVNEASTLKLYNGKISGNHKDSADGIIFVDAGTASTNGGAFYMYGGEISGNTLRRGAVYAEAAQNVKPAVIQILGGKITNNEGKGTGVRKAGAGVYSYFEVVIGGNAQISGNTAAEGAADVYLRNSYNSSAKLVLSSDVPLCRGAKINYGTEAADTATNMTTISGTPTDWGCNWVSYNGESVSYKDDKFVVGHFHTIDGAEVTYEPLSSIPTLNASHKDKHYYLTKDITLSAVVAVMGVSNVNICLNGYTIEQTRTDKTVFGFAGSNDTLTIEDCAGYYDETAQEYMGGGITSTATNKATGTLFWVTRTNTLIINGGKLFGVNSTNATGSAVFVQASNDTAKASFIMNCGAICGNTAVSGAAVYVDAGAGEGSVVDINGGYIYGNTATGSGGAIYLAGKAQVTVDDAKIYDNTAAADGGAIYVCQNASPVITNTVISGNTAGRTTGDGGGGAICLASGAQATVNGGELKDNHADGRFGGAIYASSAAVSVAGTKITGNTAKGNSAIGMYGSASAALKDTQITDNSNVVGYGAVYVASGATALKLEGKTVITGNTMKTSETEAGIPQNLYLRKNESLIDAKALGEGSNIGITLDVDKTNDELSTALEGADPSVCFVLDSEELKAKGYQVSVKNDKLVKAYGHQHDELGWEVWTDSTKLPTTSGSYYLKTDVVLTETCIPTNGHTIDLCLNGHDITMAEDVKDKRLMELRNNVTVTITDCQSQAGTITGSKNGGAFQVRAGAVLNLKAGNITGNTAKDGAAILIGAGHEIQPVGGIFNMYGGTISGNAATGLGGAIRLEAAEGYDSGTVNLYGGTISGNTAGNMGGAIHAPGKAEVNLAGGTVSGNSAVNGGGISINGDTKVTLSGTVITENTAEKTGGGIYAASGAQVTMTGGQIVKNTAKAGGGAVLQSGAVFTLTDGKISDNTAGAAGGAGLYISASFVMNGGEISGNATEEAGGGMLIYNGEAALNGGTVQKNKGGKYGGGVYLQAGSAQLGAVSITENTAKAGGGVYTTAKTESLKLSGEPVITGNTKGNLYLDSAVSMELGQLGNNAKVGISADSGFRAISKTVKTDYAASFLSDRGGYQVYFKDNALHLGAAEGHSHCVCNAQSTGCDHASQVWGVWEDATSLPTGSGNYYLATDVQLTAVTSVAKDQKLNLCLNGHTVTAAEGKRIMDIAAGAVVCITDCTDKPGSLTGGSQNYGAAISVGASGTLNLYAGNITKNKNEKDGGAVYLSAATKELKGAVMQMYGGTISDNSSTYGGAIRMAASADGLEAGTFRMYGGAISGNKASNMGGAIHAPSGATVQLWGGTISGNSAENGGAVSINGSSTLILAGAVITENTAVKTGGGIYAASGAQVELRRGEITKNSAKAAGGVLLQSKDTVFTMTGGKINENTAGVTGGGAMYVSTNAAFVMEDGEISGNTTTASGGGILIYRGKGTFNGGKLDANTADGSAGALYLQGGEAWLGKVQIVSNTAKGSAGGVYAATVSVKNASGEVAEYASTATIAGAFIAKNTSGGSGGGMFVYGKGSSATMENGEIAANTAENGGGVLAQRSTFLFKDGKIYQNRANSSGGGLYASVDSKVELSGGEIYENTCVKNGAGVYALRSTLTFSSGTIRNNTAKVSGAGMFVSGCQVTLSGGSIKNNTAGGSGAGLGIQGAAGMVDGVKKTFKSNVTMTAGTISGNDTPKAAGGVLIQSEGNVFNLQGGSVSNNHSTKFGAGIYCCSGATFNMSGGSVSYNTTEDVCGGVYQDKSNGYYTGGEICYNTSARSGGGMVISGQGYTVNIKNVKLHHNTAKVGGAVLVQGRAEPVLEGCSIYENTATTNGAGIYAYTYVNVNLKNCKVYSNTAEVDGGGVWSWATSYVTIQDSQITENVAKTGEGGGLWTRGDGFTITGSLISGNTAAGNGGGVCTGMMGSATPRRTPGVKLENTIFEKNSAGGKGGGLYQSSGSEGNLADVTFTGNTSTAEGSALWAKDEFTMHNVTATGNTSSGDGFAVYLAASDYDGQSFVAGLMKLSGNMQIQDNTGGDMYLGEKTAIVIGQAGLGQNTGIQLTMHSGLLTDWVWGAYNYEGGDQVYTITYGDRSLTDPEYAAVEEKPAEPTEGTEATGDTQASEPAKENTALYAGVGAFVVVIVAAAVLVVLLGKKKAGKAAEEAKEE